MCLYSEKLNSLAATERSFTVKMFTFQFFTLFSSLFYVAFFLGRYSVLLLLFILNIKMTDKVELKWLAD